MPVSRLLCDYLKFFILFIWSYRKNNVSLRAKFAQSYNSSLILYYFTKWTTKTILTTIMLISITKTIQNVYYMKLVI